MGGLVGFVGVFGAIAGRILIDWLVGITDRRRQLGATVSVATTEFTVYFLAQVWPDVAEEFTRREIQLDITHVRTRDFWTQPGAKGVDLICARAAADTVTAHAQHRST